MSDRTKIFFGSFGEPPYPGAASKLVKPEKADHWHVVVGGTQCSLTKENIGEHMPNFMEYAYEAGISDEKKRMARLLGIPFQ